jgi:uncharacterized protein YdaU (DUF1376 family)
MKETYFFSHDYNARQDPKMQEVLMDYGVAGIGIYWCIIEQLYEQGGRIALASIKAIAFALHVSQDDVRSIVLNYGLFDNDGEAFWSPSVERRLEERAAKTERRANAASKRWVKNTNETKNDAMHSNSDAMHSNSDAMHSNSDAMHSNSDAMQCYKKKRKEIKEKESKVNSSLSNAQVCASEEERERFLEICTFEKNFAYPQQEVERFVTHYDASGWCRKDSTVPVTNKEALARMWKPQQEGVLYPEDIRQWMAETYYKAKQAQPSEAQHILRDISSATMTISADGRHVTMACTKEAAVAIEKHYAFRPTWKLSYRIPS